jgi:hypothetical protein
MNPSPGVPINPPKTANYPVVNSDCFKTVAGGGNAQFTFTVTAPANYGPGCTLTFINTDGWGATGHGKQMSVSGLVTNPPVLYPGMTMTLTSVNGVGWVQSPAVATTKAPLNTPLYVGVSGNDGNDCLTASTPCQTLSHIFMGLLFENLLATAGSSTPNAPGFDVRLLTDNACVTTTGVNCIHGLHWSGAPRQTEGHNAIMIECDNGSATGCTIADSNSGQAIGVYCACFLELRNVTLGAGNGNNNLIQVEKGMVRLEGGVVLGPVPVSGQSQLNAINGGTIVLEGSTTTQVSGGAQNLAAAQAYGNIQLDQATLLWINNAAYASTLAAFGGFITANGTVWNTGGFTVTGTQNLQCTVNGFIDTNNSRASVPGTNTPLACAVSPNGQAN